MAQIEKRSFGPVPPLPVEHNHTAELKPAKGILKKRLRFAHLLLLALKSREEEEKKAIFWDEDNLVETSVGRGFPLTTLPPLVDNRNADED